MTKTIRHRLIVDQITTKTDKKFEPVAHMADTIVAMTLKSGRCSQQDLLVLDFTHQDISALWHFANALASVELKFCTHNINSAFVRDVRYA